VVGLKYRSYRHGLEGLTCVFCCDFYRTLCGPGAAVGLISMSVCVCTITVKRNDISPRHVLLAGSSVKFCEGHRRKMCPFWRRKPRLNKVQEK